ncbi:MAG TPA: amidohydrolase family protein [Ilumatobacter sp.]|nr:amidohydrolase family protein [Ilumatobacter sp.]
MHTPDTVPDVTTGRSTNTFFRGVKDRPRTVTFLPDPEPAPRRYTIISADDHVVEPPDTFEGRLPSKFADRAPRIVESEGGEVWLYNDQLRPDIGLNAVVGRPIAEASFEPKRFDEMRRGSWDIHARVRDMDLNGVYASVNFPSGLPGFAGQRLQLGVDPELALATVQAWNDWHIEAWTGPYPDRIIPCQVPWLLDPVVAAAQVRANAARGFKAIAFTESPEKLGLPSLHTGYWDPLMAACEETGTVVCLHVGSSSSTPTTSSDAPPETVGVLFFGYAMFSAVDWLFSKIPVRFPDIKICLAEGGIGWVAGLLDRLDHVDRYSELFDTWKGVEPTPAEVLQRNFAFCAIEDPSSFRIRDRIGVDSLLLESDYPHLDSTWPYTQDVVATALADASPDEVRKITWENASVLFRHPVPAAVAADPTAY